MESNIFKKSFFSCICWLISIENCLGIYGEFICGHKDMLTPPPTFGWLNSQVILEMCPWDTDAPAVAKFA